MQKLAIAALVLAAGCTEHGSSAGGDATAGSDLETQRFQPQICTGGQPGEPSCPVNLVALELGEGRGTFSFVVQGLGSGMFLTDMKLAPGPSGLRIQGLTLRVWVTPTTSVDVPFGMDFALPAGQTAILEPLSLVGQGTGNPVSISATSAGPFQPR
jgi:hypothetical protein